MTSKIKATEEVATTEVTISNKEEDKAVEAEVT